MKARQTRVVRPRLTPRDELVNTLEFETEAERALPADVFRAIEGFEPPPMELAEAGPSES